MQTEFLTHTLYMQFYTRIAVFLATILKTNVAQNIAICKLFFIEILLCPLYIATLCGRLRDVKNRWGSKRSVYHSEFNP